MTDARFEDGREAPLNLGALDAEDLQVLASLAQDAVFPSSEMTWDPKARRFSMLLNRFRWEEVVQTSLPPERVQSVLTFAGVESVATSGIDRGDIDLILSLLTIDFHQSDPPSGSILLTLAGDGAIKLNVEAVEATLKDVTKPYRSPSGHTPKHPD